MMQSYKQLRQSLILNMHNLASCVSQIIRHFPTTYSSSGHFAFQYGRYQDCIDSKTFRYHLIDFNVFNATDGITMGICLPKQCSHNLVSFLLTEAFDLSGTPIKVQKVISDPQNIQFDYSWLFYLTVIILLLIVLLVTVSSLMKKRQQGWLKEFRLQQNIIELFTFRQSSLSVLNGVRALTVMWIVMGDTFFNSIIGAVNVITLNFVLQRPFALLVQTTLLATDIFFFLSGFFLAYKFTQTKTNSLGSYAMSLLKKLVRIMPSYLLTLIFYYSVFLHLGSGPKWVLNDQYINVCKNMWRSILFVDNLVNNGKTLCMPWAFYLQVEMQIFLLILVVLFIYHRSKLGSLLVAAGLIVYSWTINLIYTEQHSQKYPITLGALYTFKDYIFDVYIKPQYRWTPSLYGLFFGLAYHQFLKVQGQSKTEKISFLKASIGIKIDKIKYQLQQSRVKRLGLEWGGMCILSFVTFFPRMLQLGYDWPQWFHSMCINFGRILYPFSITLILLPTILGIKNSFFTTILDTKFFNFVSRISYGIFLIHGMVIFHINWSNKQDTYLSINNTYVNTLSAIAQSCLLGFITTITVQMPCRKLLRNLSAYQKSKQEREKSGQNQQASKQGNNYEKTMLVNQSVNQ